MNAIALVGLSVLATIAFIAWLGWFLFKTPHEVLGWAVAALGVAAFTAAFTWATGRSSDILTNALIGAFCTVIGAGGFLLKTNLASILLERRDR